MVHGLEIAVITCSINSYIGRFGMIGWRFLFGRDSQEMKLRCKRLGSQR